MKTLFVGNIGGTEWLIIITILFVVLVLIPFLLGYYIGLAKGRRENSFKQKNL